MMERRVFLCLVAAGMVTSLAVARAQQAGRTYRIGYLSLRSGPAAQDEALRQGLRELGYIEGRTIAIEYRWAAWKGERLPELAAELVRLKVDVIVAAATLTAEVVKRATSTIPIVITGVGDAVGTGLINSLARPGGNITGLAVMSRELAGKRLQILLELLPRATRVAVLAHGRLSSTPLLIDEMHSAAQQAGVQLVVQEVTEAAELPAAFAAMQRERAQALVVQLSPLTTDHRTRATELAAQHRLPSSLLRRADELIQ